MTRSLPAVLPVLLLGLWLGLAAPARAVYPPPVKDDGKFFTKEGLEKANKKIREIYQKYKKDVVVETLETLTEEQQKKLKAEDEKRFFASLALARAKELGVNGVYIVICKKPRFLQIHMDPDTQKRTFKASDRTKARDAFFKQFKESMFDAGLHDALDSIEASLKANSK